ncbi:Serine/threonine-protein kinase PkaA [Durusdinium trenchii]|uniref:non-specific serine/threonine protein kinase n=1 Tax=Durusdinium trenchii TaxID=1381693 RepID=A0ABP0IJI4_9DINO
MARRHATPCVTVLLASLFLHSAWPFLGGFPRSPTGRNRRCGRRAAVGEEINGFQLEEKLGAGAFGTTWRATASDECDEELSLPAGEEVALKLIKLQDGWSALDKFEREAAVLRRVRHPAVPRFYGSILRDLPNGRDLGLVSALVRGGTLEEEVKSGRWVATPPNLRRLAETLLEVCVHLASFAPPVVHRDIKPANVLLEVNSSDSEPNVYLVDFGSAVLGSGTKTAAGTFGYMAPESFGNTFTPKSDLYGVGATLLFAATGLEPGTLPVDRLQVQFDKALVGTVWERQETWLPNLLERLLAPAPEDRFSSAAEALAALKNGGRPRLVAPTSAVARTGRRSVGLASLEPPRGSKITVKREAENRPRAVGGVGGYRVLVEDLHYGGLMDGDWAQAGELRILFPPPLLPSVGLPGTFSVAWTSFTAFWTAGVVSAGAPIMALFSLPFWQVGFTMLKDTFQPLLRGALELRISPSRWSVRTLDPLLSGRNRTTDAEIGVQRSKRRLDFETNCFWTI